MHSAGILLLRVGFVRAGRRSVFVPFFRRVILSHCTEGQTLTGLSAFFRQVVGLG